MCWHRALATNDFECLIFSHALQKLELIETNESRFMSELRKQLNRRYATQKMNPTKGVPQPTAGDAR